MNRKYLLCQFLCQLIAHIGLEVMLGLLFGGSCAVSWKSQYYFHTFQSPT